MQAFRPPDENELLLTAYAYQGGEVIGLDLGTGVVRNYSNSSAYEEAEGIAPDGDAIYVERDIAYEGVDPGALDVWRLGLRDPSDPSWERVTFLNRYAPYYASNPSVAPDGQTLAFQLSINGDVEGQGEGILLLGITGWCSQCCAPVTRRPRLSRRCGASGSAESAGPGGTRGPRRRRGARRLWRRWRRRRPTRPARRRAGR